MTNYILTHLGDDALLRELGAIVARDRAMTAVLLAHIAEVDSRKLYVGAGYSSMHAYCVRELHLSDGATYRRITAARAARRFPSLFQAVEEGRLHLAAVSLLAPHLTSENVQELIDEATHRRKNEVEALLARRFPVRDVPAKPWLIRALGPAISPTQYANSPELPLQTTPGQSDPALGRVDGAPTESLADELIPGRVATESLVPGRVEGNSLAEGGLVPERVATESLIPGRVHPAVQAQSSPPQPERFLLRLTIEKATLEKLRHLQALLSHSVPSGDLDKVLDRALQIAILDVEKQKVGADRASRAGTTIRPRTGRGVRTSPDRATTRYISARVRRAVWERDQGRCTFVSLSGKRCDEDRFLEFDHINPVARGGRSTVDGVRLRCRAHNQYEAERAFGAEFMARKRRERQASG